MVALGNDKVFSIAGAEKLNIKMRVKGFEFYYLDMSMIVVIGGGVD